MTPEGLVEFFLASAGTGGAFVGLLFVAISIGPQRTFGDPTMAAPRQGLAEATLLTLANGFVVSSIALIPTVNVGWVALVCGAWGVWAALVLARRFARLHRHGASGYAPWRHLLRVTIPSLVATGVFVIETLLGLRIILQPHDETAFGWLAATIIGLYTLGIARAWILLGDPEYGLSGWLNPLQDVMKRDEPS